MSCSTGGLVFTAVSHRRAPVAFLGVPPNPWLLGIIKLGVLIVPRPESMSNQVGQYTSIQFIAHVQLDSFSASPVARDKSSMVDTLLHSLPSYRPPRVAKDNIEIV